MKLTAKLNLFFFISIFALKWCINSHLKFVFYFFVSILFRKNCKEINVFFIIVIFYIHDIWLVFCWKTNPPLKWKNPFPTVKFTCLLTMINSYFELLLNPSFWLGLCHIWMCTRHWLWTKASPGVRISSTLYAKLMHAPPWQHDLISSFHFLSPVAMDTDGGLLWY